MTEPDQTVVRAWADTEGIWLELKMNSSITMKIPVEPGEAEVLAAQLSNAAAEWKRSRR
jgi:hypothetical protein